MYVCQTDVYIGSSRTPGTTLNIVNRWGGQLSFCFASFAIDDAPLITILSDIF